MTRARFIQRSNNTKQDLTGHLDKLRSLVHVYEGKLNEIGEKYTFSSTWWKTPNNAAARKKVGSTVFNYLWNICRSSANEAMWTSYKLKSGENIQMRNYQSAFCPCNACATNEYANRRNLVYLVNVYNHPTVKKWFIRNGTTCDDDDFALSQMLQWIWRSSIRNGEAINIFIPSKRMRNLLQNWLQYGNIVRSKKSMELYSIKFEKK